MKHQYKPGNWYLPPGYGSIQQPTAIGGLYPLEPDPTVLYLFPFLADQDFDISALGAFLTGSSDLSNTINFQCAVYNDDEWAPTGLPMAATGNIHVNATNITGGFGGDLTSPISIEKDNLYWLGLMADRASPSGGGDNYFIGVDAENSEMARRVGSSTIQGLCPFATGPNFKLLIGMKVPGQTYGTFPDPRGANATLLEVHARDSGPGSSAEDPIPLIGFRVRP